MNLPSASKPDFVQNVSREPAYQTGRPLWAEISRSALRHNYESLSRQAARSGADLICVVKANAYGHGVADCTRVLLGAGADWFAVTSVQDGLQLLHLMHDEMVQVDLDNGRILSLSGVFSREDAAHAIRSRITPVLLSLAQVEWFAEAARDEEPTHAPIRIHLEIDTGMSRHGVRWDDTAQLDAIVAVLANKPCLCLEAVLTHFASPDDASSPQNRQQIQRFSHALDYLAVRGVHPPLLHAGNSITMFEASQAEALTELAQSRGAKLRLRPGIALYGYGVADAGLQPVLTWKTRIASLREARAGDAVSYNATFHTTCATLIATLPVGYADGYNRLLSNKGTVLVRGQRATVLGRVTMDQIMIDVTAVDGVALGDEVVLLGSQGELAVSATQIATLIGTIPYEVLCRLGSRIERVLVD